MAIPKLVFGANLFTKDNGFKSAEDVKPWFDALLESKAKGLVSEIDTAAAYQQSEEYLGRLEFGSSFALATKVPGGSSPQQPATKEAVIAQAKESLSKLRVKQVICSSLTTTAPRSHTPSGSRSLAHRQGRLYNTIVRMCSSVG